MFKFSTVQHAVAGALVLAALPMAALAQGKDPVRIALVTSKSGGFATMGADVANGIKFAVEEANARGGVDGRPVTSVGQLPLGARVQGVWADGRAAPAWLPSPP